MAGTFLGHGLIAWSVNPSWIPYLVTVGFTVPMSQNVMPFIGALDVILAIWVLIRPNKYILIWMIFWAFLTAAIRPLSGESILAFVERSANWAAPLVLLMMYWPKRKGSKIIK